MWGWYPWCHEGRAKEQHRRKRPFKRSIAGGVFTERSCTGASRIFLRAVFVYFLLYAYPHPLQYLPDVRTVPQMWHDKDAPAKEVNRNLPEWVDSAYKWRGEHTMSYVKWERSAGLALRRPPRSTAGRHVALDSPGRTLLPGLCSSGVPVREGLSLAVFLPWLRAPRDALR